LRVSEESLDREESRLLRALRRHDAVVGLGWGLAVGLALEVLLALTARLTPLWHRADLLRLLPLLASSGLLLGALAGAYGERSPRRRLQRLDRQLHLAERLITAWELKRGVITAPPAMIEQQRRETVQAVRGLETGAALPLQPPPAALRVILALALLLGLALGLPNPQEERLLEEEALQAANEAATAELRSLLESVAQDPLLDPATREVALAALEEALATLESPQSSVDERMRALEGAEEALAALQDPDSQAQVERLAEAAPLSSEEVVRQMSEALQRGEPQIAAARLRELVAESGAPLTPEEVLALADAFSEMAEALRDRDPALSEQFQEIAEEIYSGDREEAHEAILEASETLEEVGEGNASNRSLESAQARLQRAEETVRAASDPGARPGEPRPGEPAGGAEASEGEAGAENGALAGGSSEHGDDTGSGTPYNTTEGTRLDEESGQISLPRARTEGSGQRGLGGAGTARTHYEDAYAEYAEAAEAELSRRSLPPAMRSYIRDYFSNLEE
jgi:hypothetical protein